MADSPQNNVYRISPIEFVAAPARLPKLAPSAVHATRQKAQEIQVRSSRNLQWLWLFPAAYFALGGLLSFSTVMAQSIVPIMAEQEAQEKAAIIRLVVDDFEYSTRQPRAAQQSGLEVAPPAIQQEQFMQPAEEAWQQKTSAPQASVYTYTLQASMPDEPATPPTTRNTATEDSFRSESKKKESHRTLATPSALMRSASTSHSSFNGGQHSTLSAFGDVGEPSEVQAMIQELRQARAAREAQQRAEAEQQARQEDAQGATVKQSSQGFQAKSLAGASGGFNKPLARLTLSSPFGKRWGRMHEGADFSATQGSPIFSAQAGKVKFSGRKGGYGLLVIVDHGNGVETRYGHCSSLLVKKGDTVSNGQRIGLVGSTGHSTGPHLHFEVREHGHAKNPFAYINA